MRRRFLTLVLAAALLSGCQRSEPVPTEAAGEITPPVAATGETTRPPEPTETYPEPEDGVFVVVTDYIPDIAVDLKYATTDNFTGQVIYDFTAVYLRYGTVVKLAAVQEDLEQLGLGLKIWDGFRPVAAQYRLWEVCPDKRYVANPNTGFSAHSRGNTVDVTLVDGEGKELPMPTGFDDFTAKADRDYSDCPQEAADNALILQILMEKHGFSGYKNEWWHFTDTEDYPVEEAFLP